MPPFSIRKKKYPDAVNQWLAQDNRQDKPTGNPADFAGMDVQTAGWTKITLPGPLAGPELLPPAGAIWIRKEITLTSVQSADALQRIILIYNAGVNDYETIYWNGEKVLQQLPKDRTSGTIRTFGLPSGI